MWSPRIGRPRRRFSHFQLAVFFLGMIVAMAERNSFGRREGARSQLGERKTGSIEGPFSIQPPPPHTNAIEI